MLSTSISYINQTKKIKFSHTSNFKKKLYKIYSITLKLFYDNDHQELSNKAVLLILNQYQKIVIRDISGSKNNTIVAVKHAILVQKQTGHVKHLKNSLPMLSTSQTCSKEVEEVSARASGPVTSAISLFAIAHSAGAVIRRI